MTCAFVGSTGRYLARILPRTRREVAYWKRRAENIPDASLRDAALDSLADKRFAIDGAALFATIPGRHDDALVRLLVAYQILCDYLDTITEWPARDQVERGRRLHQALVEAVDKDASISEHYPDRASIDDGGYVRALVVACRIACTSLPAYSRAQPNLVRDTARVQVQALNHLDDSTQRPRALQRWARTEFPNEERLRWFEISGAAASSLHIHAYFALAADHRTTAVDIKDAARVYFPWVCAAATMLDSLVDRDEDIDGGHHSYVGYYQDDFEMINRLELLTTQAASGVWGLRHPGRHAIIVAGMAAMYLSHLGDEADIDRRTVRALLNAAGPPAGVILPVMRGWRTLRAVRTRRAFKPGSRST